MRYKACVFDFTDLHTLYLHHIIIMYMIRVHKTLRPWNYNFVVYIKFKYVEYIGREKIILIFHIYVYYIMCVGLVIRGNENADLRPWKKLRTFNLL